MLYYLNNIVLFNNNNIKIAYSLKSWRMKILIGDKFTLKLFKTIKLKYFQKKTENWFILNFISALRN